MATESLRPIQDVDAKPSLTRERKYIRFFRYLSVATLAVSATALIVDSAAALIETGYETTADNGPDALGKLSVDLVICSGIALTLVEGLGAKEDKE